jgi:hypothetical protein
MFVAQEEQPFDKIPRDLRKNKPGEKMEGNWEYIAAAYLILVIVGVILGLSQKITVYRNFNDLTLCFATILVPEVFIQISSFFSTEFLQKFIVILMVVIEIGLILYIAYQTYIDNKDILSTAIAFFTKIPLAVLFILNLLEFVAPSGKTYKERMKNRKGALAWLLLLTPLIYSLVRDKEGVFNPFKYVKSRGLR